MSTIMVVAMNYQRPIATKPYQTIALLGREPGILVLENALLNNPLINLAAVYTHGLLPKKEGGLPRPELSHYINICQSAKIPLHILDLPEAKQLELYLPNEAFDLLIVLSWRCILPKQILEKPKVASINLHRGDLPKYKGAEPVLRAINAGETSISITAHHITEELDAGPIIATATMDILPCPNNMSTPDYAEKIKRDLYPLYAPLARSSIKILAQQSQETSNPV